MTAADRVATIRARIAGERAEIARAASGLRAPMRAAEAAWSVSREAARPPVPVRFVSTLLDLAGQRAISVAFRWIWWVWTIGSAARNAARLPGPEAPR